MKTWVTTVAILLASQVVADTNRLWLMPFAPPADTLPLTNLAAIMEQQSKACAPETHGVRVVVPRQMDVGPIRITGTNLTILDGVRSLATVSSTELRLADDIALLLPTTTPYRYVIVAVDGRCEDAESGAAISDIRIKPEWPYEARMYINTNGYFACGIAKRFLYWPDAGALLQTEKEFPGAVAFTLSAQGYEPKVVTNCFFQDYCGWHGQTFKLNREGRRANQASQAIGAPGAPQPER